MENLCRTVFGLSKEPFTRDVKTRDLMELENLSKVSKRLDYLLGLSGVMVVTGDVGSGKSTALRWALANYHESSHRFVNIVATSGTPLEFYKQIGWDLGLSFSSSRISVCLKEIRAAVEDIVVNKKQKIAIVVDEANLMRAQIFNELHTLGQFNHDSKPMLSILLCGLPSLLDRMCARGCEPLASRTVARVHLRPLSEPHTSDYIAHHLRVAGCKKQIFSSDALTAVYQGAGGLPRRINNLCRGAMESAAIVGDDSINAEHVRIAASELI